MIINDIINNDKGYGEFYFDDFKDALTEENRNRYEALNRKGFAARLSISHSNEWELFYYDKFKDDSPYCDGDCKITEENNDGFNRAMIKIMDEFEKYIGEEWAGTEEDIIERMVAKAVAEFRENHKNYDEDDIVSYEIDKREGIKYDLFWLRDYLSDGALLYLYDFLNDETRKRYKKFKTFVVGGRKISVEKCRYIPVNDFVNFRVGVEEEVDELDGSKHTVYLSMHTYVNPGPDISVKIEDPKSIRSISIAVNNMVNYAMDIYDGMRDMYRSYCKNKSKN